MNIQRVAREVSVRIKDKGCESIDTCPNRIDPPDLYHQRPGRCPGTSRMHWLCRTLFSRSYKERRCPCFVYTKKYILQKLSLIRRGVISS